MVLASVSSALTHGAFQRVMPVISIASMRSKQEHPIQAAEKLALQWGIGLEAAHRTLRATTQMFIRTAQMLIHGQYRTQQQQFCYN